MRRKPLSPRPFSTWKAASATGSPVGRLGRYAFCRRSPQGLVL